MHVNMHVIMLSELIHFFILREYSCVCVLICINMRKRYC